MLRSQTLLVMLIVVIVLSRGAERVVPAAPGTAIDAPTVTAEVPVSTATESPDLVTPPATDAVTPTSESRGPIGFASTPMPTVAPPTVPATEAPPTPTPEPVATERPSAPDTGQARSLIVERGSSGRLEVAFTFDAGEGAGHTAEILDMLDRYGIKGTFGVTGQWVEQNPELMQRIVQEGHQIINHTYDHRSFTGKSLDGLPLTVEERRESIERTEALISEATDGYISSPYFRFPYGDYDSASLDLLGEMGFSYTAWWSCDTLAWLDYTPDQIVGRCGVEAEDGGPGAILLLHVAQDGDWEALEPLILSYQDAGYDFVTFEEMIQP